MPSERFILASASPRRTALLSEMGIEHDVIPSRIPEQVRPSEAPADYALRLSQEKAEDVGNLIPAEESAWVLGADTIVVIDGLILEKPRTKEEAFTHLSRLSGRTHQVITAYSILKMPDKTLHSEAVASSVTMRTLTKEEIRRYIESGEPMDKAGAYALQGLGADFISEVKGSRNNVIGLPTEALQEALKRLGYGQTP